MLCSSLSHSILKKEKKEKKKKENNNNNNNQTMSFVENLGDSIGEGFAKICSNRANQVSTSKGSSLQFSLSLVKVGFSNFS